MVWLGFELSLLVFIPMLRGGSSITEGLVKYFLVQAGGSSVFVLSFLSHGFFVQERVLLVLGMFIKLGMFPFYRWVPMLMSVLTWCGCLLLSTFQKLSPLFVVFQQSLVCSNYLLFFGVLTVLIGGIIGYNQSYIRSLMAYSSVRHRGWLVICCLYRFSLFFCYLLIYVFLVCGLFSLFALLKAHKVVLGGSRFGLDGVLSLFILSLSGVPPFSLFYLKVGVIYFIVSSSFYIPLVLLGSMLSIYYYLTFVIPSLSGFWFRSFPDVGGFLVFFVFFVSFFVPCLFFF
jgi:NADH-quinone oxidoreductase subunit N